MAKGAESSLQSCTVLFCTIKWHGGQRRDNGASVPKEMTSSSRGVLPFSPYALLPPHRMLLQPRPHAQHLDTRGPTAAARGTAAVSPPGNTAGTAEDPGAALKRLRRGSTSGWSEIPILLDLESQKKKNTANSPRRTENLN